MYKDHLLSGPQLNPFDCMQPLFLQMATEGECKDFYSTRLEIYGFNRRPSGSVHLRLFGDADLVVPHALAQERH